MPFDATKEHLAKFNVDRRDAARLERALCTLADFEGSVKKALSEVGHSDHGLHDVCDAIRLIIDGDDDIHPIKEARDESTPGQYYGG